jgi:hypothetical protein
VYKELVTQGVLPSGYAADDGVAVRFRDTQFSEAVSISSAANAWRVEGADALDSSSDGARPSVETKITPRLLKSADLPLSDGEQIPHTTGDPLSRKHAGHAAHRPMTGSSGKGSAGKGPTQEDRSRASH